MTTGALIRTLIGAMLAACLLMAQPAVHASEDPLESFNRSVFAFNNKADQWVLRPVASTYADVAPEPVQRGVRNVINNIQDVNNAANALLQFRIGDAMASTSRVLINTTLGVGGIMDVAGDMGIEREYADFGQTLATWGVPQGPYLMLPLLGPSSLRAGAGTAVDAMVLSVQAQLDPAGAAAYWTTSTIDTRVQLLGVDDLISGDQYVFIREAYLQSRRALNGELDLDTGFGDFDDEFDDF